MSKGIVGEYNILLAIWQLDAIDSVVLDILHIRYNGDKSKYEQKHLVD